MFAINYEVSYSGNIEDTEDRDNELHVENDKSVKGHHNIIQKIKLQNGLGCMRKRKQEAVMQTRTYKLYTEPEKYYHSKLLLYYPWTYEEQLINGFNSYQNSYVAKQDSIHANAEHFNDDCELFDLVPEDLEDNIAQSVWNLVAPSKAQDDDTTRSHGYNTI